MKIVKSTSLIAGIVLMLGMSLSAQAQTYPCDDFREFVNYMEYTTTCHDIIQKRKRNGESVSSVAVSNYWQCESMMTNADRMGQKWLNMSQNIRLSCARLMSRKFKSAAQGYQSSLPVVKPYIDGKVE